MHAMRDSTIEIDDAFARLCRSPADGAALEDLVAAYAQAGLPVAAVRRFLAAAMSADAPADELRAADHELAGDDSHRSRWLDALVDARADRAAGRLGRVVRAALERLDELAGAKRS